MKLLREQFRKTPRKVAMMLKRSLERKQGKKK
jgi:hypothetical protein